ncbi:MAG: MogA/MoaB family molybdenum cofactor biosynthesis protein [bacterium]
MSDKSLKSFKAQIVTISDSRSTGERVDTVGPILTGILRETGAGLKDPIIVPDEKNEIVKTLIKLVDEDRIDLVITTGGTGLAPRDVTPEATLEVISKEIPGLAELVRHEGGMKTAKAYLSRGIAGVRGSSLIINIPGSERGAVQSLEILLTLLPHALETLKGESHECGSKIGETDDIHTH